MYLATINLKLKIMTHTYSITGMICAGCANHVKDQIERHPDVTQVETLIEQHKVVISMNQKVSIVKLQEFIDKDSEYAGKFYIS